MVKVKLNNYYKQESKFQSKNHDNIILNKYLGCITREKSSFYIIKL